MAISSLLILAALCCFGFGVAVALHYSGSDQHVIDDTFYSENHSDDIKNELKKSHLEYLFDQIFDMKVGNMRTADDHYDQAYSMDSVMNKLRALPESSDKQVLLNNLSYADYPYLISLSGYNELLTLAGEPKLQLKNNEAVVYMDCEFTTESRREILNKIVEQNPMVRINGNDFYLTGSVQTTNFVAYRSITLSFALIVTDEVFDPIAGENYSVYQNAVLSSTQTRNKSLLTAESDTNELLNEAGVSYESYLQNIGRNLFFVVSASYITIYLAIVFLIIANTVIGIQFLTRQQRTRHRYQTLIRLGASYHSLCHSARTQINWYFGIPVIMASISSLFGVRALYSGLLSSSARAQVSRMIGISFTMIVILFVIECVYTKIIKRLSDRYLLSLMTLQREE